MSHAIALPLTATLDLLALWTLELQLPGRLAQPAGRPSRPASRGGNPAGS